MAELVVDFNIDWYLGDVETDSNNNRTIGSKGERGRIEIGTNESNGFIVIPISSLKELIIITTLLNGKKPIFLTLLKDILVQLIEIKIIKIYTSLISGGSRRAIPPYYYIAMEENKI